MCRTSYETVYREFDAPWMQQLRREAYGEDIGQHSWVTADELRADIVRLGLSAASRLVDLGCGPGGPLTFVLGNVRCRGTGVEWSPEALRVAAARARSLRVDALFETRAADLNEPLPFESHAFDSAIALDVVLHLRERAMFFREVARVLEPRGRFLFTDAGVLTGAITDEEVRARSVYGGARFLPLGMNEELVESAGFRLLETEDRTSSVVRNASGRLEAMATHRRHLERVWGAAEVERQRRYLGTVVDLAERRVLSRFMYLVGTRDSGLGTRDSGLGTRDSKEEGSDYPKWRCRESRNGSDFITKNGTNTLNQTEPPMSKITPFLWFDGKAEEAMNFYASIFPESKVLSVTRMQGQVMSVEFELQGQRFMGLNAGPHHKFNEAVSFLIGCDTQEEIDDYWAKLTADGGEPGRCGWLKDKFGLSWQVVPNALSKWLSGPDAAGTGRVVNAFMQMSKFDLNALQAAYDGT